MRKRLMCRCANCNRRLANMKGVKSFRGEFVCSRCFKIGRRCRWIDYR